MPPPLRFIPWFCGLPCEPMTLEVREEGPIVAEGGCPACRLEVALFHEEDRPPRVAGEDGSAGRAGEAAAPVPEEGRPPFVSRLLPGPAPTPPPPRAPARAVLAARA